MDSTKTPEDVDMDNEPDQFLADLPPLAEPIGSVLSSSMQPTPLASSAAEPQERRAQVGASPYLAPFTPSASPPRPKTLSTTTGHSAIGTTRTTMPQIALVSRSGSAEAFEPGPALLQDDVVNHLPPKLLETLVNIIRTLDQLATGVADFRPEQLNFMSEKAQRYVELLHDADRAAVEYSASIPLEVLKMIEEGTNPELYTKARMEKCQDESTRTAAQVETLKVLKSALQTGLDTI
ncbi:hypothetical protein CCR75_008374 [Bremia lactucae]|uniref:Mediator of RNA polymerase II transcription subunit 10 n=1 Tax=Bremia lactucae TaxID=4779 RepID=A0A976FGX7_BRELC|nr:hypothetical protein CCR75_008374 [Bremia lactucae]